MQIRPRQLKRDVLASVHFHRKPLLAFYLYFAIFAFALWAPLSGWMLTGLVRAAGQAAIGNEDLLRFAITPYGMTWIVLALTLAAVLIFLQHAGMMLVATRDARGKFHSATNALWQVLKRLPKLLALGAIQVFTHLLLLLPLFAILVFAFQSLLAPYDIYYVLQAQPYEFWAFLSVLAGCVLIALMVNGSVYVRWMLALPILLIEDLSPWQALKRSARLTCSVRLKLGSMVVLIAAIVAMIPITLSLLFDGMGWFITSILPQQYGVQITMMVLLLAAYALANLLAGFVAVSINSLVMLKIYHRRCKKQRGITVDTEPRYAGWCAVGVEFVVVVVALVHLLIAMNAFDDRDDVLNIAHRGHSWNAPENTLVAIEKAIDAGAHYIEIDVRHSADGVLVLKHDRDMLRIADDPRAIWEIPYEELAAMDAGSWFSPEFRGEYVPTLADAIERVRGRAGLYLEVKGAPQMPDLVPMVIAQLEEENMLDHTIFASLSPADLMEAQAIAPNLRTSLLVHTAVGVVERQPFHILAMRDGLVTPGRLSRVRNHDQELHVWTVNDPMQMRRFLDIGVDGIITDRPDVLTEIMQERAEMSRPEVWLMRFRHWLW